MVTQAIHVRFAGPTDFRGSRYIAKCQAGRKVWHSDHALNPSQNARKAAEALRDHLQWNTARHGDMAGGAMPDGSYVFVFVERSELGAALADLVDKATTVSARWSSGDLAGAVRELDKAAENGAAALVAARVKGDLVDRCLASVARMLPWLGKMIADGGHLQAVLPNDAEAAMRQAQALLDDARSRGYLP
jgi:hypothetical protein